MKTLFTWYVDSKSGRHNRSFQVRLYSVYLKTVLGLLLLIITGNQVQGQSCQTPSIPSTVQLNFACRLYTFSAVKINGTTTTTGSVNPGSAVSVSFNWSVAQAPNCTYCPGCVVVSYWGINGVYNNCFKVFGGFGNTGGSSSATFTAPTTPGIYYVTLGIQLDFVCRSGTGWTSCEPGHAFAAIIVGNPKNDAEITISGISKSNDTTLLVADTTGNACSGRLNGFKWLKNDTLISGAGSISYSATSLGTYRAVWFNCKGHADTSAPYVITNTKIVGNSVEPVEIEAGAMNNLKVDGDSGAILKGDIIVNGNLELKKGTLDMGDKTITLNGKLDIKGGTLKGSDKATLLIKGKDSTVLLPKLDLKKLEVDRKNAEVKMQGMLKIKDSLTLRSGKLKMDTSTLKINGNIGYKGGELIGGPMAKLHVGGTGNTVELKKLQLEQLKVETVRKVLLKNVLEIKEKLDLDDGELDMDTSTIILEGDLVQKRGKLKGSPEAKLDIRGTKDTVRLPKMDVKTLTVDRPAGVKLKEEVTVHSNLDLKKGPVKIDTTRLVLKGGLTHNGGTLEGGPKAKLTVTGNGASIELKSLELERLKMDRQADIVIKDLMTVHKEIELLKGKIQIGESKLTVMGNLKWGIGELIGGPNSKMNLFGLNESRAELRKLELKEMTLEREAGVLLKGEMKIYDRIDLLNGDLDLDTSRLVLLGNLLQDKGKLKGGPEAKLDIKGTKDTVKLTKLEVKTLSVDRPAGVKLKEEVTVHSNLDLKKGPVKIDTTRLVLKGGLTHNGGTLEGGPKAKLTVTGNGSDVELKKLELENLKMDRQADVFIKELMTIHKDIDLLKGQIQIGESQLTLKGDLKQTGGKLVGGPQSKLTVDGLNAKKIDLKELELKEMSIKRAAGAALKGQMQLHDKLELLDGDLDLDTSRLILLGDLLQDKGKLKGGPEAKLDIKGTKDTVKLSKLEVKTLSVDRPAGVKLKEEVIVNNNLDLKKGPVKIDTTRLVLKGGITQGGGKLEGGEKAKLTVAGNGGNIEIKSLELENLKMDRQADVLIKDLMTIHKDMELLKGQIQIGESQLKVMGDLKFFGGALIGGTMAKLIVDGQNAKQMQLKALELKELSVKRDAGLLLKGQMQIHDKLELLKGDLNLDTSRLVLLGDLVADKGKIKGTKDSKLEVKGTAGQVTLPGGNLGNLTVDRPKGVKLDSTLTVDKNLDVKNGKIDVGTNKIKLDDKATVSGGSKDAYIKTSTQTTTKPGTSTGKNTVTRTPAGTVQGTPQPVSANTLAKRMHNPVGFNPYLPVDIETEDSMVAFEIGVTDSVLRSNQSNLAASDAVNYTWHISATVDAEVDISFGWDPDKELTGFDRTKSYVAYREADTIPWKKTGIDGAIFDDLDSIYRKTLSGFNFKGGLTYQFTIADASSPLAMFTTVQKTDATCNGGKDGEATVSVTGGVAPYKYEWTSGSGDTAATANKLVAGKYKVTVTDADGNQEADSVTITEPTAVNVSGTVTDVLCNGKSTGAIALTVSGGTVSAPGGYTYSWSSGATTKDLNDVPAGNYTLTVTDSRGCKGSKSFTISQPSALQADAGEDVTICYGSSATLSVSASGGTQPYTYSWSNGGTSSSTTVSPLANTIYTVKVTDANGCTASDAVTVHIDHTAPTVLTKDVTIYLDANGKASITTADIDNGTSDACSFSLSLDKTSFDCLNLGTNAVKLKATDGAGNSASANATVTVKDNIAPTVITKDVTIYLDANGKASITISDIDDGSYDNCNVSLVLDKTSFGCANTGANTVTLTATDGSGNVTSKSATVTVKDNIAPTLITKNITIYLDANGSATIGTSDVDNGSYDNCSFSLTLDKTSFDCSNTGANTVTLTATDASGNVTSKTATVTVKDNTAPTVITKKITIYLDGNGSASINTSSVDGGSYDNCSFTLALDKTSFGCSNTGNNTVTLTATDASGNTTSKTATVTVKDNTAPTVITKDITIYLDANGSASVGTSDIDNGSYDNCSFSLVLDKTSFDCSNVGNNTVTLTATDASGNVTSKTAIVTVKDAIVPTVITQDITIYLDANGSASITASDINNGSYDNCTIASYALDITSFGCSNTGANTVTLTVTDVNGNSNSATATVTVKDAINPVAKAKNISITLNDATGSASITTSDVDNGSYDNCSFSLSLDKTSFNCSNVGGNTVTLTATDASGNTHSVTAVVTVKTTLAASAGSDVTVYYGYAPMASATLTAGGSGGSGSYTYKWSTGGTTKSITVSPTSTTTYTATVTDSKGCVATDEVKVTVVDVRCGNKMDKVMICHNGNTLCIDASAVPAHLGNHSSDYIGQCNGRAIINEDSDHHDEEIETGNHASAQLTAYPNPFANATTIEFTMGRTQWVSLEVYDIKGARVATLFTGEAGQGVTNYASFDASQLKADVYFARLITESEVRIVKLILVR